MPVLLKEVNHVKNRNVCKENGLPPGQFNNILFSVVISPSVTIYELF